MNLKNYAKSEAEMLLEQFGITGQLAKDFIAHRKAKRASLIKRNSTVCKTGGQGWDFDL